MSKMLFHAPGVATFVDDDGVPGKHPITVYPNAHDHSDSISICWGMTADAAEALAADILKAVAALREAVPAPSPEAA